MWRWGRAAGELAGGWPARGSSSDLETARPKRHSRGTVAQVKPSVPPQRRHPLAAALPAVCSKKHHFSLIISFLWAIDPSLPSSQTPLPVSGQRDNLLKQWSKKWASATRLPRQAHVPGRRGPAHASLRAWHRLHFSLLRSRVSESDQGQRTSALSATYHAPSAELLPVSRTALPRALSFKCKFEI